MDSRFRFLLIIGVTALLGWQFFGKRSDAPAPVFDQPGNPPGADTRGGPERTVTLRLGGVNVEIGTYSGAVVHAALTEASFADQGHPIDLRQTTLEAFRPLSSRVQVERAGARALPEYLTFQVVRESPNEVELRAAPAGSDVEVFRTFRGATAYAIETTTRIVNHGGSGRLTFSQGVWHYVREAEESTSWGRRPWQVAEALCNHDNDKLERTTRSELIDRVEKEHTDLISSAANYVGVGNQYFLSALVPSGDGGHPACHLRAEPRGRNAEGHPDGHLIHGVLRYPPTMLGEGATQTYRATAYFGPKRRADLTAAAPILHDALNLGMFASIGQLLLWIMRQFHGLVHNWGLAIILLTISVRVALWPLLSWSNRTMIEMQRFQPQMQAINEKYKDDPEARGLATMEMYREAGVNPMSQFKGCLPALAQMPVFFALYASLQSSVELFHAPFTLWWRDLSAPDPYLVLPLVIGAVFFLQQKLMPPAMPDPVQAKMMLYGMPVMFTAFSLFAPSGLGVYMLVNSLVSIVQQKINRAQLDKARAAMSGGASAITVTPAAAPDGKKAQGRRKGGPGNGR